MGEPPRVVRQILEQAPIGIVVAEMNEGHRLSYVNPAFEEITGYAASDALGKNCRYLQGSDRMQPEILQMQDAISRRSAISVTLRNYRRDGRMFWNQLRMEPAGGADVEPSHYIGFIQDVTQQKETLERLGQTLQMDRLTGIPNRDGFLDRCENLVASHPDGLSLVVKINIANFHDINTGFGYDTGDLLLLEIARRIKTISATAIGRLAADEFGLAFPIALADDAERVLASLSSVLSPRYVLPGAEICVRFGMGYVVGEPGADALTLVRRAGAALRDSRRTKLRETRRSEEGSEMRARNRIRLATELQQALTHKEFDLNYQPKVDLATGRLVGAEALLRWRHGLFGQQLPDRFIDLAEDTGLILDIGSRSMRTVMGFACTVNRRLSRKLNFSINVSVSEFMHRDMVSFMASVLNESGADPSWFTLELTESLLADSSPRMVGIFQGLRELGVGLSIDDFGTGYSSLRYLEAFPVSEVKLDRSFVQGMCRSATKRLVMEAVIRLAGELNMTVIAEGVETEAERSGLQDMGCRFAQGFLFSRPIAADAFADLAFGDISLRPPNKAVAAQESAAFRHHEQRFHGEPGAVRDAETADAPRMHSAHIFRGHTTCGRADHYDNCNERLQC